MADTNDATNGPTIDHLAYPHVIERVLQFADARTLLAFSRTAQAYRPCAAVATRHIVVEPCGRSLALRSSRGSLGIEVEPQAHHIPAHAHIPMASLTHTRVLDFIGPVGRNAPRLLQSIPADIVRVIQRDGIARHNFVAFKSTTTIVFGDLVLRSDAHVSAYWSGPGVPPNTRLVWNIKGIRSGSPVTNKLTDKGLREMVLHFSIDSICKLQPEWFDLLSKWIMILSNLEEIKMRFVGLDELLERLDMPPTSIWILARGKLGKRASFISAEAYELEVGREQYELETCEELW
ncbi:hypothetical protein CcaverHIS002_0411610 [Cutaneotrichosporon cavernicola]|uniref:F-box domain-containing protein n=1 Tax=Cutaneotrichosporon cavernicola TaxID=279322 RepID=A0AA48L5G5_9TREE|nr:uncharacterized protein CcaverHIS019_0411540 [Cutaneotrichosporon cavernicola]BEI84557.1 hypothetical protein CcaverHIS002_0411610 [Cutaneotrichosporon cavernicola]BEI92334.1 hypothetical protein CcaverHIS019_0411540 [Cutaneotrichosporon cavernicola]BEJ00104.1 hypothetical protein CcaverHIS631_0411460 [Cutaneotrichosporon cavernicola]BEJ07875.1 hypothetical protein CcaverHIS641_0411440 [Cutaneotrichosporon cavernicola]